MNFLYYTVTTIFFEDIHLKFSIRHDLKKLRLQFLRICYEIDMSKIM